jgi:hypothetical protein
MEGFGAIALRELNPRITLVSDETVRGIARMRVHFLNGWGASIIRSEHSYGGEDGLFEMLAIDPSGTMLTDQIFGWLSEAEVMKAIDAISNFEDGQPVAIDDWDALAHGVAAH